MLKKLSLALLPILAILGCATLDNLTGPSDEYVRGLRFYDRGQYDMAKKQWEPLALKGDCDAQFRYGMLYFVAKGVPQDNKEALKWWKLAANQGQPRAQIALGDLYYQGNKVDAACLNCDIKRDLVEGLKWYTLGKKSAVYDGEKTYLDRVLTGIKPEMTPAQIREAEKKAGAWKPTPAACRPRKLL